MNPWRAALTSATASGKRTRLASRSATACSSARRPKCPARVYAQGGRRPDRAVEAVTKAARRQIPVAYRRAWINQSGVVELTPSHYQVIDVLRLGVAPNIGNAAATPLIGLHR